MSYVIFDLDHTVIDSTHRQATLPDGSLDLEHWFEKARPNFIAQDQLLPLARVMRTLYQHSTIIVCTARCMQEADFQFLDDNNLPYHVMLSRSHEGFCPISNRPINSDERGDADMKASLLLNYFQSQGFPDIASARPIMFDDNVKVIDRLAREGVTMYDANIANERLTA